MDAEKKTNVMETATAGDSHAPRKLTFAENATLTVKLLLAVGLVGTAFWAANLWTSAK